MGNTSCFGQPAWCLHILIQCISLENETFSLFQMFTCKVFSLLCIEFTKLIPWILNFTVWLSTPDVHWRWKALQIIWFRGKFTGRLTGNPSREWPTPPISTCFPWTSLKLEDYEEDNKSGTCKTSQQSCGSGRVQSHRMLELVAVSRPQGLRLALVLRGFQKTWQAALGQCYYYYVDI